MAPIPTMSMETLASCAETGQYGAVKISTANNIRFIMRQIDAWREGRQSRKIKPEILLKAGFPMLHGSLALDGQVRVRRASMTARF
jgi:hypothetical protein